MRTALTAIVLAGALGLPAQAGLLINPTGIFLTEPEISPVIVDEATGQARFGSPAGGFRRTGRSGFFPTPVDPGLPRQGRNAFGAEGFKAEPQLHGRVEKKLSDVDIFFGLFD